MNREFKIGFIAIVALVVLLIGVNYLKGINLFDNNRTIYAIYPNIGGLQQGSGVSVNGFKVGIVKKISLLTEENYNLMVELSIKEDLDIPVNSIAKIVNEDIMGSKGIALILGDANINIEEGDTINADIEGSLKDEVNKQVIPLKNKAEELIASIYSVVTVITSVLSKDARESLPKSLESLDKTFSTMSKTMTKVNRIELPWDEFTKMCTNTKYRESCKMNSNKYYSRNYLILPNKSIFKFCAWEYV